VRYFFDTEFIDDGEIIDLISIGIVAEDGREYYAESNSFNHSKAGEWVRAHVFPKLTGPAKPRKKIAKEVIAFVGDAPEFWGYYADYDWVVLCQLYGSMMALPKNWPMFCLDLKQLVVSLGNPKLELQSHGHHNALDDARWVRETWTKLSRSGGS